MVHELFNDGLCTVSTATIAAGTASYSVGSVAGVRVGAFREALGIKLLGLLAMYFGLHYAACGAMCNVGTGSKTGQEMLTYGILGLFGGLGLVLWAVNGKPQRFVVFLNIGGNDVALVQYPTMAKAEEAAAAIRVAMKPR